MIKIELDQKKALVTGGASGIGREIALGLAEAGADVAVHYGSNQKGAEEVKEIITNMGRQCIIVQADMLKTEEIDNLFDAVENEFDGTLDILVNNAGNMVERSSVEEMREALWRQVIDLNLTSAFLVSQRAVPMMKENGGRIINMTSLAAQNGGGPGAAAYAASKGGLMTFTKGLAKELAPNVTVNNVSPGFIGETAFHDTFTSDEARKNIVSSLPLKREGTPKDVLGTVFYLVSDYGSFITGETIEVNGGALMR
ncbi:3-oxoacyl-[acyl-carrier protein] reductase [Salibacterium halotolerans]|uniref:3-oxoacyl-[acyl-carrier protein] reductase n=1 Tax=Salibacterium halotolerans TaxID=1884432 RepID=A0A1I5LDL9_9BACI|nr:glucose 1-dehydrogenase [Salibacterium halotolerans]SFO95390.1 3-oxoacyl-[acyl-carrier protein] reductase [Salibacterium halotolerans]